ncbi:CPBP family intramembrane glutamic endopeptidase [Jiangella muralis]|uniref:CPBP family intramembrane glutamic endopeptidase n=1 Tax=Jiangella muralis TaxID=702383 RepID=UPI00069CDA4C|nr:CPBP family intramembrane glutamic endopeptidase [Jiangella muralis]
MTGRDLPVWGFLAVVVGYLAIIQGGGLLAAEIAGIEADEAFTTASNVMITMWIPLGAALVFTYAVVGVLGWWRPVLTDDRPVRRWVWAVPIVLMAAIVLAIDYADLLDKSVVFVLTLFVATQFVGWGEEGMFRGIGVTTLRRRGLREGQVALWSSLIFGAVHLSNLIGRGPGAIGQAVAVSFAGYFFYLIRRVSGGNVLNSVLHGLFDFALLSGTAILIGQDAYPGAVAAIAAYIVLAVLLLVRRHRIEPVPASTGMVPDPPR